MSEGEKKSGETSTHRLEETEAFYNSRIFFGGGISLTVRNKARSHFPESDTHDCKSEGFGRIDLPDKVKRETANYDACPGALSVNLADVSLEKKIVTTE